MMLFRIGGVPIAIGRYRFWRGRWVKKWGIGSPELSWRHGAISMGAWKILW